MLKRLLGWSVLILLVACGRPDEADLEVADYVRYGFGGGELGAEWTEVTVRGDGEVSYRFVQPYAGEWPQKETSGEVVLSPDETRAFFRSVVDAGLLSLEGDRSPGVDVPVTEVEAVIAGRRVRESMAGIHDQGPHLVLKELVAEIKAGNGLVLFPTDAVARVPPAAAE